AASPGNCGSGAAGAPVLAHAASIGKERALRSVAGNPILSVPHRAASRYSPSAHAQRRDPTDWKCSALAGMAYLHVFPGWPAHSPAPGHTLGEALFLCAVSRTFQITLSLSHSLCYFAVLLAAPAAGGLDCFHCGCVVVDSD